MSEPRKFLHQDREPIEQGHWYSVMDANVVGRFTGRFVDERAVFEIYPPFGHMHEDTYQRKDVYRSVRPINIVSFLRDRRQQVSEIETTLAQSPPASTALPPDSHNAIYQDMHRRGPVKKDKGFVHPNRKD